jgi:uncharacterized protein
MYRKYRINDINKKLAIIGVQPLDLMVVGATGAGKSTTLNSFFQREVSKIGKGVDPETMLINSFSLNDSFRLWDTPGLGDGIIRDKEHSKMLIDLMFKDYKEQGYTFGFIDLVLIIVDGSGRDMGTTYNLINNVIIPNFQPDRILVAINQADVAMKGRNWNRQSMKPERELKQFLENKVVSIQERIFEATSVKIKTPVYYTAEYNYNVDKLFDLIIDNMPTKKRNIKL